MENKKGFTIKIVPDAGDTVHTIHLSMKMAKIGIISFAAVLLLFVAAFSYSIYNTLVVKNDETEMEKLRQVSNIQGVPQAMASARTLGKASPKLLLNT